MQKKKLFLTIMIVALAIIFIFTLAACNKKDNSTNTTDVKTEAVVGTTEIKLAGIQANETITLISQATDVTPDSTISFNLENAISTERGVYSIITKDGDTNAYGNTQYIYNLYEKIDVAGGYRYITTRTVYIGGYTYTYFAVAQRLDTQLESTAGNYDLFLMDVNGKYLSTITHLEEFTYGYNEINQLNSQLNYLHLTYESQFYQDGGYFIIYFFDSNQGTEGQAYKVYKSDYVAELYQTATVPSLVVNDKYNERKPVPGLSGYYYIDSKSSNQVLFYNSYGARNATNTLSLDFGFEKVLSTNYEGGKVFIYTSAELPSDNLEYDYEASMGILSVHYRARLYVYDIASGVLNRILNNYYIDSSYNILQGTDNKVYLSVKLSAIGNKLKSETTMTYVVDTDGNILVSTPELLSQNNFMLSLNNGSYIYNGSHMYLFDKYLNTISRIDNVIDSGNTLFIAEDAENYYCVDLDNTIKVSNLKISEISSISMYGDALIVEKTDGKSYAYVDGQEKLMLEDPEYDSGYIGYGLWLVDTYVPDTYDHTYQFKTCANDTSIISIEHAQSYSIQKNGNGARIKITLADYTTKYYKCN